MFDLATSIRRILLHLLFATAGKGEQDEEYDTASKAPQSAPGNVTLCQTALGPLLPNICTFMTDGRHRFVVADHPFQKQIAGLVE